MSDAHRDEIAKLEALFAEHPEGRIFTHLAEAYRKAGELERARAVLEEGLERHPAYSSAHVVLGRVLADQDRIDEAETEFRRVLELDSHNLVALRSLGDLARARGAGDEALEYYTRLLDVEPADADVRDLVEALNAGELSAPREPLAPPSEEPAWSIGEPSPPEAAEELTPPEPGPLTGGDADAFAAFDGNSIEAEHVESESIEPEPLLESSWPGAEEAEAVAPSALGPDVEAFAIEGAPGEPIGGEERGEGADLDRAGLDAGFEGFEEPVFEAAASEEAGFEVWEPEGAEPEETDREEANLDESGSDGELPDLQRPWLDEPEHVAGFGSDEMAGFEPEATAGFEPEEAAGFESESEHELEPEVEAGGPQPWAGSGRAGEEVEGEPVAKPPSSSGVMTETIAQVYARQGLYDRAAEVYRDLLRSRPGEVRLRERLKEMEQLAVEAETTSAELAGSASEDSGIEAAPAGSTGEGEGAGIGAEEPGGSAGEDAESASWSPYPDEEEGVAGETAAELAPEEASVWTEAEWGESESASPYAWGEEAPEPDASPPIRDYMRSLMEWSESGAPPAAGGASESTSRMAEEPTDEPEVEDDDDLETFRSWLESLKR